MYALQETGPAMSALKEEEGEEQQDGSAAAFSLEGAAAPAVTEVGTSDPVNDFMAMIKQENLDGAFSSLSKAVVTLVQNSMGNRCDTSSCICAGACYFAVHCYHSTLPLIGNRYTATALQWLPAGYDLATSPHFQEHIIFCGTVWASCLMHAL